ncbi:hypothetical protein LguiB_020542 [Lonicera macranthoides]
MYIILFNTPPHVRVARTWIDKRNQRPNRPNQMCISCTNTKGETNASGRIRTRDLAEPEL